MGKIVMVGSEKGGVGKSAIARNLAVFSVMNGKDTCLVDADPQGTVITWHTKRLDHEPYVHVVQMTTALDKEGRPDRLGISNRLAAEAKRHDVVIVDVGGRASSELVTSMTVADLLITPFSPSEDDTLTLGKVLKLVDEAEFRRGRGLPVLAVASLVLPANASETREILRKTFEGLEDKIVLSDNLIFRRQAHIRLFNEGLCAADNKELDYKAHTEMLFLYNEIMEED
jgi:chromosome partitioning protein